MPTADRANFARCVCSAASREEMATSSSVLDAPVSNAATRSPREWNLSLLRPKQGGEIVRNLGLPNSDRKQQSELRLDDREMVLGRWQGRAGLAVEQPAPRKTPPQPPRRTSVPAAAQPAFRAASGTQRAQPSRRAWPHQSQYLPISWEASLARRRGAQPSTPLGKAPMYRQQRRTMPQQYSALRNSTYSTLSKDTLHRSGCATHGGLLRRWDEDRASERAGRGAGGARRSRATLWAPDLAISTEVRLRQPSRGRPESQPNPRRLCCPGKSQGQTGLEPKWRCTMQRTSR